MKRKGSAQAAGRGVIGKRKSAELAAAGESVVREFLSKEEPKLTTKQDREKPGYQSGKQTGIAAEEYIEQNGQKHPPEQGKHRTSSASGEDSWDH